MSAKPMPAKWDEFKRFYTIVEGGKGWLIYECSPRPALHKPLTTENFAFFGCDWSEYGFDFAPFGVFFQDHCQCDAAWESLWQWLHSRKGAYQNNGPQPDTEKMQSQEAAQVADELKRALRDTAQRSGPEGGDDHA